MILNEVEDSIPSVQLSAILYSMVETVKANNLKPYDYFKHLFAEIPKHVDGKFLDDLLTWSEKLAAECRREEKITH